MRLYTAVPSTLLAAGSVLPTTTMVRRDHVLAKTTQLVQYDEL